MLVDGGYSGEKFAKEIKTILKAEVEVVKRQINAKFTRCCVHDTNAFGHDFFANAVTSDHCNAFLTHLQPLEIKR